MLNRIPVVPDERECEDCGCLFDARNKKHGLIHQCERCGRAEEWDRDVKRYLGRRGGETKTDGCTIYRTNLETIQAILNTENRAGRSANLSLGNPARPEKGSRDDKRP
jgi:hypothetical protein